jgi:hypothetical protein
VVVLLADHDPCPCGSDRSAGGCCLRTFPIRKGDGRLVYERAIVVPQADTRPPPPVTGKAVSGCYAACLSDCDGELEDEHFVSHRMLKMLAGESKALTVRGIDPKDPDGVRSVAVKRIATRALFASQPGASSDRHRRKPVLRDALDSWEPARE